MYQTSTHIGKLDEHHPELCGLCCVLCERAAVRKLAREAQQQREAAERRASLPAAERVAKLVASHPGLFRAALGLGVQS